MKMTMNAKLTASIFLCASMMFQAAHADQVFSYTESFTNPDDAQSTMVLSGTFSESETGALTSLSSSIFENGTFMLALNVESISARRFFTPADASTGLPLQIDGFFIGPSGNRNTITSCGQVFLDGGGCASWQSRDPTVPSQGMTNIRTNGVGPGGDLLSDDFFAQTGALQITAVPEPMTVAMLFSGLGLLFAAGRRKNTTV
jgi:hypothetical protein